MSAAIRRRIGSPRPRSISNTLDPMALETAISPNPSLATRMELMASCTCMYAKKEEVKFMNYMCLYFQLGRAVCVCVCVCVCVVALTGMLAPMAMTTRPIVNSPMFRIQPERMTSVTMAKLMAEIQKMDMMKATVILYHLWLLEQSGMVQLKAVT